jgi:hypothetical protein
VPRAFPRAWRAAYAIGSFGTRKAGARIYLEVFHAPDQAALLGNPSLARANFNTKFASSPGTDMDEPVKTVESLMPWSWLLSGHMQSTLALEARRFATVITLIFADYPPGWAEHA